MVQLLNLRNHLQLIVTLTSQQPTSCEWQEKKTACWLKRIRTLIPRPISPSSYELSLLRSAVHLYTIINRQFRTCQLKVNYSLNLNLRWESNPPCELHVYCFNFSLQACMRSVKPISPHPPTCCFHSYGDVFLVKWWDSNPYSFSFPLMFLPLKLPPNNCKLTVGKLLNLQYWYKTVSHCRDLLVLFNFWYSVWELNPSYQIENLGSFADRRTEHFCQYVK